MFQVQGEPAGTLPVWTGSEARYGDSSQPDRSGRSGPSRSGRHGRRDFPRTALSTGSRRRLRQSAGGLEADRPPLCGARHAAAAPPPGAGPHGEWRMSAPEYLRPLPLPLDLPQRQVDPSPARSFGKWPRVRTARRTVLFRLSIAFAPAGSREEPPRPVPPPATMRELPAPGTPSSASSASSTCRLVDRTQRPRQLLPILPGRVRQRIPDRFTTTSAPSPPETPPRSPPETPSTRPPPQSTHPERPAPSTRSSPPTRTSPPRCAVHIPKIPSAPAPTPLERHVLNPPGSPATRDMFGYTASKGRERHSRSSS